MITYLNHGAGANFQASSYYLSLSFIQQMFTGFSEPVVVTVPTFAARSVKGFRSAADSFAAYESDSDSIQGLEDGAESIKGDTR